MKETCFMCNKFFIEHSIEQLRQCYNDFHSQFNRNEDIFNFYFKRLK